MSRKLIGLRGSELKIWLMTIALVCGVSSVIFFFEVTEVDGYAFDGRRTRMV